MTSGDKMTGQNNVPDVLVRIIFFENPFVNGIYRLVRAEDSRVFWRGPDDAIYSGTITKKDDCFHGLVAYFVADVLVETAG
jgi:hypothetical protein